MGVRGRDLVGATEGLGELFAPPTTDAAGSPVLSSFSNRSDKERAVFEEFPYCGDCRIATYYDGRARDGPCPEHRRAGM